MTARRSERVSEKGNRADLLDIYVSGPRHALVTCYGRRDWDVLTAEVFEAEKGRWAARLFTGPGQSVVHSFGKDRGAAEDAAIEHSQNLSNFAVVPADRTGAGRRRERFGG